MQLYVVLLLTFLRLAFTNQDVKNTTDNMTHSGMSHAAGQKEHPKSDILGDVQNNEVDVSADVVNEVCEHGCRDNILSHPDNKWLDLVDVTDSTLELLPAVGAPAAGRTAQSSQQATELLVSSWNDLNTWTKHNDTSSICEQDVERTIAGYNTNQMWALRMFDAWAKPGPSLLDGRSAFVGNYYHCRDRKAPTEDKRTGFTGNYCVVTLANLTNTDNSNFFRMITLARLLVGTCMPDTCSQDDVTRVVNERLQAINVTQFLLAVSTDCRTEEREYTTFTKVAILIVVVIGTLSFLGTIIDLLVIQFPDWGKSSESDKKDTTTGPENQNKVHITGDSLGLWTKVFLSFSVYTNGRRLLNTSQVPGSINVIPGIRFITMSWIVIGHTHFLLFMTHASNNVQGLDSVAKLRVADILASMSLGVDSFFAISGFLVSYLTIKQVIDKGWGYNWKQFFLHRYWRLTPTLMVAFVLVQGLQRFMVSGAMAPTLQPSDKVACEKNWWLLPLYLNNLLQTNMEEVCFGHAWSLAVDFQFYLLSPLMLIPFYYHKNAGILSCAVFVIGQWILAAFLNYRTNGAIAMIRYSLECFQYVYFPFYSRIGPFALGILSGYILSANNGRVSLSKSMVATGWFVATTAAIAVIFGVHGDYTGESVSSLLVASIFNAVYRSVWGACVCWMIVACASGYGGPVSVFLSWPPFTVLGRLTYIGYLIQMPVSTIIFENLEQPQYLSLFSVVVFGAVDLFFTSLVSAILVICVEFPTFNLEKVLLSKSKTL